jgi:methylenetetrahydrofolate dehydrogenase (NADP+)/methenyltetrahydrofolate cyclohydrolase
MSSSVFKFFKKHMQTTIINGRQIRNEILEKVKEGVTNLSFQPVFCDVLVGSDPVSKQYIDMKAKTAESVGIHFHHAEFPESITTDELVGEIKKLNNVPNMCGLIVQLPLPPHLDKEKILNAIDQHIDVDCLGSEASNVFYNTDISIGYPTAMACMAIIDSIDYDLNNKNIVVMGQGELVGRPVTHLLRIRGLQVDTITRKTENKEELLKNADVIISGTGQGKYLTGDMIKEGVLIVDAGTSESTGGIVGDVDTDSVLGVASYVSPVPGGVGPVTVSMLLNNVLTVAKQKK